MKTFISCSLAALFCVACASNTAQKTDSAESESPGATKRAIQQSQDGFGEAAMSPLEDVNLVRDEIPDYLKTIKNPYNVETEISCDMIALEVTRLDSLLGRDWDIPPPDKKGLTERAADGASTAFLDTVSSSASGLIPYRGIVRTVTGANRHASKVRKAYERGSHRRTFLKAMGLVKGCEYPAAPLPLPEEDPKVVFR
ncbi:MAG: hypothetical protein NXH72_07110 [Hyphomonadaceae bacterium]|nr:hypothetical protein [Hyphomonadaceae bacterium]